MCQRYAALLLTGKILLQCLSAAVYLQICSALKVQSSLQSTDLKDCFQTLKDVMKRNLKSLSETELRVFVYFSLVGEPLRVFNKSFYVREAEEEGTDVEPLKNDINTAGSLFAQGAHLVTF